ncbi:MAG: isoaspartyl peptidase/L-asparaginase family protein [Steroidobacteraceae bacterium]|jgi:beta-aspartyl-peptidase (threonine type)
MLPRLALFILCVVASAPAWCEESPSMFGIAIHGGAGVISRASMTPESEAAYRRDLESALDAGYAVLARGGSGLDAVTTAVRILEDSPLFNAGRGAVFNHEGINELDASIMDGKDLQAGAVAGVRHVRNPVLLARAVMEDSPHVMLTGTGAEEFALERGIELVPRSYFFTERRWNQLERARKGDRLSAADLGYYGTVGAVARDQQGNLAAATSTGGMTNKRWGRVGDSPVIGAGNYADNRSCAVSATGSGEYFIRSVLAHEIAALIRHRGLDAATAAREAVSQSLAGIGGDGGVIVIDHAGRIAMEFNTEGMFRGARDASGRREVSIY